MFRKKLENQAFEFLDHSLIKGCIVICVFGYLFILYQENTKMFLEHLATEFYKTINQTIIGCILFSLF